MPAGKHTCPASNRPAPRCWRLPLVTGFCSACRVYMREAHIVRGRRQAFCGRCCPVCSRCWEDEHAGA
jgi:hypothetical protein